MEEIIQLREEDQESAKQATDHDKAVIQLLDQLFPTRPSHLWAPGCVLQQLLCQLHVAATANRRGSCDCCHFSAGKIPAVYNSFGRKQLLQCLATDAALCRGLFSFVFGHAAASAEQQLQSPLENLQSQKRPVETNTGNRSYAGAAADNEAAEEDETCALIAKLLQTEALTSDPPTAFYESSLVDLQSLFCAELRHDMRCFLRWRPLRGNGFHYLQQQHQEKDVDEMLHKLQSEKADLLQQLHQLKNKQKCMEDQQRILLQQQSHTLLSGANPREVAAAASMASGGFATGKQLLVSRRKQGLLTPDDEAALHALEESQPQDQGRKKIRGDESLEGSRNMSSNRGSTQEVSTGGRTNVTRYEDLIGGDVSDEILQWVLHMRLHPPGSLQKKGASSEGEEIAGLQRVKKLLRDKIINPILRPELHVGLHQAPRGILLFGPPGTGKTTLAKWMAVCSGASFFEVTPSSIISKFQGETETLIKTLFKVAERDSPSVIFIDEIDSLLGKRRDREDDSSIRMKNQLLQMMDGVSSCGSETILVVVGATNRPDMLDEAALRRLTKRVLVPLPDAAAICFLIRTVLDKQSAGGCALTNEELSRLAEKLVGWSGSDIRSLCVTASERSYDEAIQAFGGIENIPSRSAFRSISFADFLDAMKQVRPSACSAEGSKFFETWAQQHGAL